MPLCDLHLIMDPEMPKECVMPARNRAPDLANITLVSPYSDPHFPGEETEVHMR